jgi:hypothetical protein
MMIPIILPIRPQRLASQSHPFDQLPRHLHLAKPL